MLGLKFAYATNGTGIIEFDLHHRPGTLSVDAVPDAGRALGAADAKDAARARLRGRERLSDPLFTRRQSARPATTSRSPSTARSRPFSRASAACCSRWRPAPARPPWPFRSAGSSGTARWNRTGEHRRPQHPLPRRPQHPRGRPEGQDLRPVRRRPLQDRERRGGQEPRDVLRDLPGARRGRAPAGSVQRVPARLLRPRSSSTSATAAAPATRATGARSSNTSSPPISSA